MRLLGRGRCNTRLGGDGIGLGCRGCDCNGGQFSRVCGHGSHGVCYGGRVTFSGGLRNCLGLGVGTGDSITFGRSLGDGCKVKFRRGRNVGLGRSLHCGCSISLRRGHGVGFRGVLCQSNGVSFGRCLSSG